MLKTENQVTKSMTMHDRIILSTKFEEVTAVCSFSIRLLDFFLTINQKKGSDAAMTMGTESTVYAEEASHNNDLLDQILPASVSDYVELVNAHIVAGG